MSNEIKEGKRLVCRVQLCYKTKTREGTTSSTWVTLKEDHIVEIIHFEGMSLNGLCPNKSFILNRG